ncbi:MAG: hypothetical protein AMK69_11085 [Nitrospira bacterium SG8_3]|nr:MAG: hypothetical protein AMK69_11085 [Nitrospira bacterium SG8_3]
MESEQQFTQELDRFVNVAAAAFLVGVSRQTLSKYVKQGKLAVYRSKIGTFLLKEEVVRFKEEKEVKEREALERKRRALSESVRGQVE